MTNKNKAAELAIKLEGEIGTSPHSRQAIEEAFVEMADWNDKKTESKLRKAFLCMIVRQDHSLSNKEHQYIDIDIVQNIIESFFNVKLVEYDK